VAPLAGRLADRYGSRWVISVGMSLLAFSYLFLWGEERAHASTTLHLIALAVGVVILDIGAQMTQVANQTRIFGLVPEARSRINTVYMTIYFIGAAIGSAFATVAWVHWKWNGVCRLAVGLIALAGLRHAMGYHLEDKGKLHATIEDELMEA
jgi:MFS family permease